MGFNARELDQRVILRRYTELPNEYGTLVRTAHQLGIVSAKVRPMSGRERDHAQQTDARANYLVVIRARDDITERDYVVWMGQELNIRFVKRRPRARFLELECERVSAA
jgi:SPP1 family predicted phage head-tail adaptor